MSPDDTEERLDVAAEGHQRRGHCSLSWERQIRLTVPVSNSESATRVSTAGPVASGSRLVDAAVAQPLRVTNLDPECRASLTPEGFDVGVEMTVERRLALGGPLIVRLGRARIAIARSVAARVIVEPAEAPRPGC
jgi:Fe2+ transport system protein FeoA